LRAYCLIRPQPHYRRDAFVAGLEREAFGVKCAPPGGEPAPGDVLLIWNRYADMQACADRWEAKGGRVVVAENGYIGRDRDGHQRYAIALHGHNGSGTWPRGGPERWRALGVPLAPWREGGDYILVAPNRSFGMRGLAMPGRWADEVVRRLRMVTSSPIRVRPHPGNHAPAVPLERDLERARSVVIWASSVGVHALVAGVPVTCESPFWICKSATRSEPATVNLRPAERPDRLPALERLAWAQWTLEEIAAGVPFRYLLSEAREGEERATA
jgi:hypothetical protein